MTRRHRTLLAAVAAGRVYRSHGGHTLVEGGRGYSTRAGREFRDLQRRGLVELTLTGRYGLTGAGEREIASVRGAAAR
jgi:hypothetical protein